MSLAPGARVGPYEIRSVLGSGGMGVVYRAHDPKLDRDVALKLLPAELAKDADRLRRFELEARSASALNHPTIVAIYDLGQADSQPYISMELVSGETLRQILQAGAMPARRALQIAAPIADGLAKAHEAGIVHRDLKPENLMVSHDGFAKILDFGLAKLVDESDARAALATATAKATWPGSVVGTVGYMSPEQARGATADSRSDQFSFGLVLYEMLTGQRAFDRQTSVETLSAIIRDDPRPLEQVNPSVPAPIRWVVDRCLAKNPADRYGSTRDLARDLASARDHYSELTTSSATGLTSVPAIRVRRREIVAWALVAALGLAAVAVWFQPTENAAADPNRIVRFTFAPPKDVTFTSSIGSSPFALSPDGRHLIFVGSGAGNPRRLWLHSFDSLESRPIPGTEGAFVPFWSPDSLSVGFFTQAALKRVAISGGDVTTICEARFGGGATWNRDGVILFAPSIDSALFRVSAAGGTATPVTVLDTSKAESAHLGPLFLPDGRHFLFGVIGGQEQGHYVGSLDSRERKRLSMDGLIVSMLGFSEPDFVLFTRDRTLMAQRFDLTRLDLTGEPLRVAEDVDRLGTSASFAVSSSGAALVHWNGSDTITQPTWFRRDGTVDGTLGPPAGYRNVALSPDGRQAAIDRFDGTPGIWLLDRARGTTTRATSGALYESTPVWSPDSSQFVFAKATDGPPNLHVKRISTGVEERLFHNVLQSFPQSWSPDGRFIVYATTDPKTNSQDIWKVPVSGDRTPTPVLGTQFNEVSPRISPDGRWIAYSSNESGRLGVYVTGFPEPVGKWQVSTNGGNFPIWRRDGRELFYRAPDGTLMAVPVAEGPDFAPGTPIPLFQPRAAVGGLGAGTFYDVAPDGRFLINILVERTSPPATVVLNWTAGLTAPQ